MVGELPGLLGFLIACQPCNPTSSLHTFLQCDALQHSDRQEDSCEILVLEVQFSCWEAGAESFSHCYNPCFFHVYPLTGPAVEDEIQQYHRARCWAESAERCDGRARWHRYDHSVGWSCTGTQCCRPWLVVRRKRGCEHHGVKGRWCGQLVQSFCDQQLWWVATESTPEPAISWAHLDEAEGFFTGSPMSSVSEDHLSAWTHKPMAGNSPGSRKSTALAPLLMACTKVSWHHGRVGSVDPALGWNREVCCLCHLKRSQRSFRLVGGQQQALVLGAVYSRLCAAEADTTELSQSWG